jgi:hypothetical protein
MVVFDKESVKRVLNGRISVSGKCNKCGCVEIHRFSEKRWRNVKRRIFVSRLNKLNFIDLYKICSRCEGE